MVELGFVLLVLCDIEEFLTLSLAIEASRAISLLILDEHDSHVTWEFLDYFLQSDIIPVWLPAHSTHILQVIDMRLFGPVQQNYSNSWDD